ncbi:hypothetical protein [Methylobacterium oxalidis]|uniref:Uncharacterized protein n=1 Tax=Methylobacterium oxalidis TaxID=944322 RepID=A0A512JDU5_9HYPH|nr:hypothetical protein [Methylobacterium oxalidis]GEP08123.1 hypothetical protein MOX02_61610 [Methylobacterium oxalidis]GJE35905.1 hypothetical protein LDDCCGHA_6126 [Methylobacterium oxalidis]GLS65382.1 hypothetical protein GCM10007888_37640 [Methylobacterium oxalidis]
MEFDRAELAHLREMRCLSEDACGHTIYAGLTRLESEEYFALMRPGGADRHEGEASNAHNARRARFLALHHRMRNAQLQAMARDQYAAMEAASTTLTSGSSEMVIARHRELVANNTKRLTAA